MHDAIVSTDVDPILRIESFAMINLRDVSTKLYFNFTFTMQTYKELMMVLALMNISSVFLGYRSSGLVVMMVW